MKTKQEVEKAVNIKGKIIVTKCDVKSKEERAKCEEQHENERISTRGNVGLKFINRAC